MKYILLKVPVFIYLLLIGFLIYSLAEAVLPTPYSAFFSLPTAVLMAASLRISSTLQEKEGNYTPTKYLWWWV